MSTEGQEFCLRCGDPRRDAKGVAALCWPPGSEDYFVRHQWKRRDTGKRDKERLQAWIQAAR